MIGQLFFSIVLRGFSSTVFSSVSCRVLALNTGLYYLGAFVSLVQCIVQELCESRGGRPGLSVLTSLLVSVDVKIY